MKARSLLLPPLLGIILPLLALILTSCIKDVNPDEEMPPITREGRGTFGCYIDGRLYVITDGRGKRGDRESLYFGRNLYPDDLYIITNDSRVPPHHVGRLHIYSTNQPLMGVNPLHDSSSFHIWATINQPFSKSITTRPTNDLFGPKDSLSHVQGFVRITRLEGSRMAGTFAFKAWRDFDARDGYAIDTIRVTDGRFDL